MSRNKSNKSTSFFKRSIRIFMSIAVLTALILGISFSIKSLSELNSTSLVTMSSPYFEQAGISSHQVGVVAGALAARIQKTELSTVDADNVSTIVDTSDVDHVSEDPLEIPHTEEPVISVGVLADSHSDNINYNKALIQLTTVHDVDVLIHLGDHTDLGLLDALQASYDLLKATKLPFYAVPGDRDLYDSVGPDNFKQVFGHDYHVFTLKGYKFIMLNNSAQYTLIDTETIQQFKADIVDADFVFLSQPLYYPDDNIAFSKKIMGYDGDGNKVLLIREQALELLEIIRDSDVRAIVAAEQHISSTNIDPVKSSLKHMVVGAITSRINNISQSVLQKPRYSILNIYADDTFKLQEEIL
ncbi:metallophosphoesterase family protein [candidate division WWE3 bacterium]|uniref:Metallophosphoesterase family protein n=1 Tax=candidate division WWE3 bacterium TaxID=2053526 RepID=A0A955J1R3_UNCKA|nr:metallophosphoesterase family protein [candidate division WWE3 bacterium]